MAMEEQMMPGNNAMGAAPEAPGTTVSTMDYPELEGVEVGDPVSGTWQGTVESVDGDMVRITYSNLEVETKNPADKELEKISGQDEKKPSSFDEEDEDF